MAQETSPGDEILEIMTPFIGGNMTVHIEKDVPFHHIQTQIEYVFREVGKFTKITIRKEADGWTLLFT